MDRRKSLKLIITGAVAAPAVIAGCKTDDKKDNTGKEEPKFDLDRNPDVWYLVSTIVSRLQDFYSMHGRLVKSFLRSSN